MPISLTPISHGVLCHGHKWVVTDDDALAELIALVALGQARHVTKILAASTFMSTAVSSRTASEGAIAMLTVSGTDPWHRDGWMFQIMSWIAAHVQSPGALIKTPQMRHADKGLDGLRLDLDAKRGKVRAVVIFEDKATANPRATIRDRVWPELAEFESGKHDNVLLAELIALLGTGRGIDIDQAIKDVLWKRHRYFRLSITTDGSYATDAARKGLFKGFDDVVKGNRLRRGGETLQLPSLRTWMDSIASKAISAVGKLV